MFEWKLYRTDNISFHNIAFAFAVARAVWRCKQQKIYLIVRILPPAYCENARVTIALLYARHARNVP